MGGATIQADGLDGPVRHVQHAPAGRLVHAAALHAHEAVLHQVQAPDAVGTAELVQLGQQHRGGELLAVDRHGVALLELDLDVRGLVGSLFGRHGAREHVVGGLRPGVLHDVALVGDVQQVGVHAVGGLVALTRRHLNALRLRVLDQARARVQIPDAPRGDALHIGLQCVVAQLEADLVVTLAGSAVADGIGADLLRDLYLPLSDQGACDGCAEEVRALVQRVHPEHRENVVAHELLTQVVDVNLLDAELLSLEAGRLQFLSLAEIGGEGDDLAAVGVLQPSQNHRGVQTTRVCQHHLLRGVVREGIHVLRGDRHALAGHAADRSLRAHGRTQHRAPLGGTRHL
mmetsp:Transcript_21646/g.36169  ORF Transcript_21646/g.36169 Transcript_21646/m.36169 type:complete len:344 (-) Transcript_21646:133-1164(-)